MGRRRVILACAIAITAAAAWTLTILVMRPRIDPDTQLDRLLASRPGLRVPGLVRMDVRAFYEGRDLAPAWIDGNALTPQVGFALDVLDSAAAHGLNPGDYDAGTLRADRNALAATPADARATRAYTESLLDFDLRLTSALLSLGHDVSVGRFSPAEMDPSWHTRRDPPNLPRTLSQAIGADLARWLDDIAPSHAEYAALKAALADPDRLDATGRDDAARVIAANMERWRWVPDDFGDHYFYVNIPTFTLVARDRGATSLTMRVVVGKPDTNETPMLSSRISGVVLSPSWNIPASIVAKETVPAVLRDPTYLTAHGIDALRPAGSGFVRVDPATLKGAKAGDLKRLLYRQRPGETNALGLVKFPFPNEYDVYLHDTPSDGSFGRTMRALSHGCVRLEKPELLVRHALPDWTPAQIAKAMRSGREQFVKLPEPIQVHLVYFTVSVGDDGRLNFLPDVYHLDTRQPGRPINVGGGRFARLW